MFACASRRVGCVVIAIHPESCENVKAPPFSPTGNFSSLALGAVPLTITSLSPSSGDMRYATHWPFGESDVAFMRAEREDVFEIHRAFRGGRRVLRRHGHERDDRDDEHQHGGESQAFHWQSSRPVRAPVHPWVGEW